MNPIGSCEELRRFCLERQAAAFGVAALASVRTNDFLLSETILKDLPRAISIAVRLSPAILSTLEGHPNQLYEHHYRQANFALDRLALTVADHIQSLGQQALPIPASQIVDWQSQRGHLSHKRVAVAAGLGWLGRNNLLVTPEFGSQVRLVTILTDLPLECGGLPPLSRIGKDLSFHTLPLEEEGEGDSAAGGQRSAVSGKRFACGSCHACIPACPAGAISERPEDFNHQACYERLKDFQRKRYVSQYICGLCVAACPGTGGSQPAADSRD